MNSDAPSSQPQQQLRQTSLTLIRSASATFTGGAASSIANAGQNAAPSAAGDIETGQRPAQDQYQPIRQPSQRRVGQGQTQDEVQQRLVEEMTAFVTNNVSWIVAGVFCLTVLLITMFVLFVLALVAAVFHGDKPCDQPLKWYVFIVLCWGQLPGRLTEIVARQLSIYDGDIRKVFLSLVFTLPSWGLLAWGVYMVKTSKTCQKTNPELFYPTERYIYGQVVFMAIMFFVGFFSALGLRQFLIWMSGFIVKPGCVEAVRKMPKVEIGSSELIDEDDGEIKACSICLDTLSEEGHLQRQNSVLAAGGNAKVSSIVKTPCGHFFHEDCLVKWCKNHLDCPLCREPLGDPDPSDEHRAADASAQASSESATQPLTAEP